MLLKEESQITSSNSKYYFELEKLYLWQVLIIKKQFVIMSVDYLPQSKFFDTGTNIPLL